jgi:hypothetical protein
MVETRRQAQRKYFASEKGRASRNKAQRKYSATEKGQEVQRKYEKSEKARERKRRYLESLTPEQRERLQEKQREAKRLSARRRREKGKQKNLASGVDILE